jgi:hypothetical protein
VTPILLLVLNPATSSLSAQLVDFNLGDKGVGPLLDWVQAYFTPPRDDRAPQQSVAEVLCGASAVFCTNRMPLVLQHAGHSRTVVGYEVMKNQEVNLLIFDPSRYVTFSVINCKVNLSTVRAGNQRRRSAKLASKPFRLGMRSLPLSLLLAAKLNPLILHLRPATLPTSPVAMLTRLGDAT